MWRELDLEKRYPPDPMLHLLLNSSNARFMIEIRLVV